MASSPLFVSCMLLIFDCFTQSFADTCKILNDNPEWKLALKKIEELQKTVKIQDDRIRNAIQRVQQSGVDRLTIYHKTPK